MKIPHPLSVESALARREIAPPAVTRREATPLTLSERAENYAAQGRPAMTPAQSRRAWHKDRRNASE